MYKNSIRTKNNQDNIRSCLTASLISSAEKFDPKQDGRYKDQQEFVFQSIIDAIRSQGITIDHKQGNDLVGGLAFETMQVTLYTPDRKKVIAHQLVYDRLINEQSSMMSILFNNDADKVTMMTALKNSRFLKKK